MGTELCFDRAMNNTNFLLKANFIEFFDHHSWLESTQITATIRTRTFTDLRVVKFIEKLGGIMVHRFYDV